MRLSTISGMLLAGLLLVLAIPAHAQFETEWERTSRDDAAESTPEWFGASTERSLAYGVVGGVERLYVPSRSGEAFTIRIIDPNTGEDIDDVVINTAGISGGAVAFNAIAVSDDGKIFVSNLTTDTGASPFKVYMWEDEAADPVVAIEYDGGAHRLGDHIDVVGSVDDGTAVLYAATSGANNVIRWAMKEDSENAGQFVFVESPREFIGLPSIAAWGSPGWALGVAPGEDSDFIASGRSVTFSRLYTNEGANLGYIEWTAGEFNQNVGSAEYLRVGGASYLATYHPTQRRGALVNVNAEPPGGTWTQRYESIYGTLPVMGETTENTHGDITTRVNDDGTVTLFVLGTNNGIGAYTTDESVAEPHSVAQARREALGTELTVEVVVGRSMGAFTYAQDNTGGITIRQTADSFRDSVDTGAIVPGTRLSVTGVTSEFNGLFQVNQGDITEWEILGQEDPPAPAVITLNDLVTNGEAYEGRIVQIDRLQTSSTAETFSAGTSYSVFDATTGEGEVELRIPNASDTEIAGQAVPQSRFTFVGAVGQFSFDDPDAGYQLMAINEDDIVATPASVLDDPVWVFNAGDVPYFADDGNVRGGAYNPVSDHVLVASRTGGVNIFVLHPASGVTLGQLDMTDVAGGAFAINEVAVTSDGQIFGANLDTGGSAVRIYRWADETASPEVVFDGALEAGRYGDAFAVGGAGNTVRLYLAGGENSNIAKLTWDGEEVGDPEYIEVGSQRARMGIAEVPGQDSLWISHPGDPLAKISNEAGEVDEFREVDSDVIPTDFGDVAYFTHGGREYIMSGPQYQADHAFVVVDVTDPGSEFVVYRTMALGENANGNGVGFAAWDSKRGNVIGGATNNAIAVFSIADYDNTAPTMAEIGAPDDGDEVRVEGDADATFTAAWDASTDDDDDTVYYRWQLSADEGFGTILVDTLVGTDTSVTINFGTLAALLDDAGVDGGTSLSAYHRVVASDGDFDVEGAASGVTLFRGRLTNVDGGSHLPREFALDGNYPNPFNPTTNIRFDLPEAADVHIEVFDILGRRVMTVPSQALQAGAGLTIQVDASQLASGTYLYRVVAEMASETRMESGKMLLIK